MLEFLRLSSILSKDMIREKVSWKACTLRQVSNGRLYLGDQGKDDKMGSLCEWKLSKLVDDRIQRI